MPPMETLVIGYFPDGDENGAKVALAMSYDGKRLMNSPSSSISHHFLATHWQPLPKPPIEKMTKRLKTFRFDLRLIIGLGYWKVIHVEDTIEISGVTHNLILPLIHVQWGYLDIPEKYLN